MKLRIAPLTLAGLLMAIAINAGLLVAIASEVVSDNLAAADKVEWNPSLPASVGNVVSRRPIEAYRPIVASPVFFKSREPYVPPPPAPPPVLIATPPPVVVDPGLVLGGVVIRNSVRKAYVFSRAGAGGAWKAEGEEFLGWKVRSIDETGAKLEQKGRAIELQLYPAQ